MGRYRTGGCMCGEVRFRVEGEPIRTGLCHCKDCRKYSGSAFTIFAVWPLSWFSMSGHIGTYAGRSFCTNCGARLFSLRAEEAEIMVGSLDEAPSTLIPSYELWVGRREEWLPELPWTDLHQGDRDPNRESWRQPMRVGHTGGGR
ncbi:GFA family protein [Mesorhizobium yinganensis]|uniref:GFA family protein n=1 Tax=Mesorhizobium yinganensis TaxID=3157707 RepID=UPI003CCD1B3F